MIWALLVRFLLFWEPFLGHFGSLGIVLGPQNCPKRPPEEPRSTPDQSPKGVWGTALGPAFLRGFRETQWKNTFFHAFLRPVKSYLGKGAWGLHFYMVFVR